MSDGWRGWFAAHTGPAWNDEIVVVRLELLHRSMPFDYLNYLYLTES